MTAKSQRVGEREQTSTRMEDRIAAEEREREEQTTHQQQQR
jgi:hypothetical protein